MENGPAKKEEKAQYRGGKKKPLISDTFVQG